MSLFKLKKHSASSPAATGYVKWLIARKLKIVAEEEIQKILAEFEGRLRAAIAQDITVHIGDMVQTTLPMNHEQDVIIKVFVESKAPAKSCQIGVAYPDRLRP